MSSPLKVGIGAVLLAGAVALFFMNNSTTPVLQDAFYFDLAQHQLVVAPVGDSATPPDANRPVARVYACGECTPANRKVHYLSMLTDAGREAAARKIELHDEAGRLKRDADLTAGTLVAREPQAGAKPDWKSANTAAGQAIMQWPADICGNERVTVCSP